jgi:hypothetical protein
MENKTYNNRNHDKLTRIDENIKYIISITNEMEPRISKLEKWQNYMAGALIIISALIPLLISLIIIILNKVF